MFTISAACIYHIQVLLFVFLFFFKKRPARVQTFSENATRFRWTCTRGGWRSLCCVATTRNVFYELQGNRYQFFQLPHKLLSHAKSKLSSFKVHSKCCNNREKKKRKLANLWRSSGKLLAGECFATRYITRPFEAERSDACLNSRGWFFLMIQRATLRCRATFTALVQFITEQQDVASLQPGEAGGLGQRECLLCWLIMSQW